jgi:hypothetical protein
MPTGSFPVRIRLTRRRAPRPLSRGSAWLTIFAVAAVAAGAVVIPASGANTNGSVSLSVGVVPPPVKSVSVSPGSTTYTGCKYGNSTSTQLGFPNGMCASASTVQITNGTAPSTIVINGASMVPVDNGTPWTLCNPSAAGSGACTGPPTDTHTILGTVNFPGTDQYVETSANGPGFVWDGSISSSANYRVLSNNTGCDNVGCTISANQQWSDNLAILGPQGSSDPSTSFSTTITWTVS